MCITYIVLDEVRVIFLNAIIKNRHNRASTSNTPALVNVNDVHIQATITMLSTFNHFNQLSYCLLLVK